MEVFDCNTTKEILNSVFQSKVQRNKSYSLRAFSRDLKIAPQTLSNVLNNRHNISIERAKELAERLSFSSEETDFFVTMAEIECSRNKFQIEKAKKKIKSLRDHSYLRNLESHQMNVLSDPLNSVFLQLMKTEAYDGSIDFLSKRLGIKGPQIEKKLKLLEKIGLVCHEDGLYREKTSDFKVKSTLPSVQIQKYHRQVLKKAVKSVTENSMNNRLLHTTVAAIDEKTYSKIVQIIEEAQKHILSEMKNSESKKAVYAFSMQFFPMEKELLST